MTSVVSAMTNVSSAFETLNKLGAGIAGSNMLTKSVETCMKMEEDLATAIKLRFFASTLQKCHEALTTCKDCLDGEGPAIEERMKAAHKEAMAAVEAANQVIIKIRGFAEDLVADFSEEGCPHEKMEMACANFIDNANKIHPKLDEAQAKLIDAAVKMNIVEADIVTVMNKFDKHVKELEDAASAKAKAVRGWVYGFVGVLSLGVGMAIAAPIVEGCALPALRAAVQKTTSQIREYSAEFTQMSKEAHEVSGSLANKKADLTEIMGKMDDVQKNVERAAKNTDDAHKRQMEIYMKRAVLRGRELMDMCDKSLASSRDSTSTVG